MSMMSVEALSDLILQQAVENHAREVYGEDRNNDINLFKSPSKTFYEPIKERDDKYEY